MSDYTPPAISTPVTPPNGGTGVANNAASTLTISGNFGTTFTVTGTTALTLPTSGTLVTTTTLNNGTLPASFTTVSSGNGTVSACGVSVGGAGNGLYYDTGSAQFRLAVGGADIVALYGSGSGRTLQAAVAIGSPLYINVANGAPVIETNVANFVKISSGINFQLGNSATTGLIAGALAALTTASIVIYDATGTAYRVPCVTP